MRVIAGKARSISLVTVKGMETRPTTDRIKETLFNMIQYDVPNATFLDLFSGSGAIGIEALSRGAEHAYFVEKNKEAIRCIETNLKKCKLEEDATVMAVDYMNALKQLEREKVTFDLVFMDPPYNHEFEKAVLIFLAKSDLIDKDSTVIVEASLDTRMDYLEELELEVIKEKKYKTNKHIFVRKREKA
jgi:16S rRNA (guanine966-N2)-methyltransferase